MAISRLCSIPDCGKAAKKLGYCDGHWWRFHKHGDPLSGGTAVGEAFRYYRDVVRAYEGEECLHWPFAKYTGGYGQITIDGTPCLVHRLVCEEVNGPPPSPDHEAAHSCGKGHLGCVAKRHVAWKTPVENKADMLIHGTRSRGTKNGNAKITEDDVRAIRSLEGTASQSAIAQRFGITQITVSRIFRREIWDWLD